VNNFKQVEEYLNKHGYSAMHRNPEYTWANFASLDGRTSVEIFLKDGEFRAIGCGFIPKSMIQIKTGDFSIPSNALFFNLNKIERAVILYENDLDEE
jgi:hypothetical protein